MLPKKWIGRFTEINDSNREIVYGQEKVHTDVDGIELLKRKGDQVGEMLTDHELKKIRLLKMKQAVKHVDRKGFRSDTESDQDEEGEEEQEETPDAGAEAEPSSEEEDPE